MCDVPATILDLAGGLLPGTVDGSPIPLKTLAGFQPQAYPPAGNGTAQLVQGQNQLSTPREQ
jgi:hypothetical protein